MVERERAEDRLLTKKQCAEYLAQSIRTIDNMLAAGELTGYRVRSKILFRLSELDALVEARRIRM